MPTTATIPARFTVMSADMAISTRAHTGLAHPATLAPGLTPTTGTWDGSARQCKAGTNTLPLPGPCEIPPVPSPHPATRRRVPPVRVPPVRVPPVRVPPVRVPPVHVVQAERKPQLRQRPAFREFPPAFREFPPKSHRTHFHSKPASDQQAKFAAAATKQSRSYTQQFSDQELQQEPGGSLSTG